LAPASPLATSSPSGTAGPPPEPRAHTSTRRETAHAAGHSDTDTRTHTDTRIDADAEVEVEVEVGDRRHGPRRDHGELIATVDVWQLDDLKWPIMRVLTPGYVDHVELDHYLNHLLASGRWREVYAEPHAEPRAGSPRRLQHVFDVYGERA
jgi:hypothetical protein